MASRNTLHIEVVTADRELYNGEAEFVALAQFHQSVERFLAPCRRNLNLVLIREIVFTLPLGFDDDLSGIR